MRYILCKEMGAFLCIVFYRKFGARKKMTVSVKSTIIKTMMTAKEISDSQKILGGYKVVFTLSIQFYS